MAESMVSQVGFLDSHPYGARIRLALDCVSHASGVVKRWAGKISQYDLKAENGDPTDPVTAIDHEIEDYICTRVQSQFSEDFILAEEAHRSGSHFGTNESCTWILDPVDGTKNFIHGSHHCSISLAIAVGEQVEFGVVAAPLLGETFWAVRGLGAFSSLKGRVEVSEIIDLPRAALTYDINSREDATLDLWLQRCRRLLAYPVQTLRCHGSAALELCGVARGATEAHIEAGLDLWDIAAGWLILKEAGGCLFDLNGLPIASISQFKGDVLACNSKEIAGLVLQVIDANDECLKDTKSKDVKRMRVE